MRFHLRSPTDDGVDRPDLDTPQGAKATGTNRPKQTHQTNMVWRINTNTKTRFTLSLASTTQYLTQHTQPDQVCSTCLSVAYSSRETPGPIPNPEAKPARADGTATGRLWESKKPPTPNNKQTTSYKPKERGPLKQHRFNGPLFSCVFTHTTTTQHEQPQPYCLCLVSRPARRVKT